MSNFGISNLFNTIYSFTFSWVTFLECPTASHWSSQHYMLLLPHLAMQNLCCALPKGLSENTSLTCGVGNWELEANPCMLSGWQWKQCANVFIGLWVLRGACPLRWGSSQHVRSDLPWAFSPLKRSQCDMSFEDLPLDGQFLFFLPRSKVNH